MTEIMPFPKNNIILFYWTAPSDVLFILEKAVDRFEPSNATVRWTVAGDGSTEPNFKFSFQRKENCTKSGRYLFSLPNIRKDVLFILEKRQI